jgi:hypothetical protein
MKPYLIVAVIVFFMFLPLFSYVIQAVRAATGG